MMTDLDKETVDFVPNYDETTEEPTVLPAPFPNLLVNGSAGIAVGMATNIPPHNMREVIDAAIWTIESAQADAPPTLRRSSASCSSSCRAPTSPPAATSSAARASSRRTSPAAARSSCARRPRSRCRRRAIARRSSSREIPYQVNKARLIERIAELVREKTIEGISDIRDESDRDGMRIVDRPEARRGRRGHPQQSLQAHRAAEQLRHHHARHRRRPAEGALARRADRQLRRVPARGRAPADRIRAAQGRSAPAHSRRTEDRARSPRRGHHADSQRQEPRRGARRPDDAVQPVADPGAGDPRHAAAAADRPRAAEDSRRARRAAEADRAAARDPVERSARDADHRRGAAEGAGEVRRRATHRDPRRGRRVPHRGPDCRRRHGDHGQQHRLHQADGDHELPEPAPRRQGPHRHADARRGLRQSISSWRRRTPTS